MPRGIYDRTKTKTQKTPDKTAKATPAKRKYTKKSDLLKANPEKASFQDTVSLAKFADSVATASFDTSYLMIEVRSNLSVLAAVAAKFEDTVGLASEIEAHVAILSGLRKKVFAQESTNSIESDEAPATDKEVEEDTSTPQNGSVYMTVPLPPLPPGSVVAAR